MSSIYIDILKLVDQNGGRVTIEQLYFKFGLQHEMVKSRIANLVKNGYLKKIVFGVYERSQSKLKPIAVL